MRNHSKCDGYAYFFLAFKYRDYQNICLQKHFLYSTEFESSLECEY